MLRTLFRLFFPNTCACCQLSLMGPELFLCSECLMELPFTHYQYQPGNSLEKVFWGRCRIRNGLAFIHYKKGGAAQRIIHEIKYHNNFKLAEYMGLLYGSELALFAEREQIEAVIAVPLHENKLKERGYNQSAYFAQGLSKRLLIPDCSDNVIRLKETSTQTKKNRFERWQNVHAIFQVKQPEKFENKHVLLVDDVITTGATMESLVHCFSSIPGCKVSIGGIAYAGQN